MPKNTLPFARVESVTARISWWDDVPTGYASAMPLPDERGKTQGAGPKVNETLNTFLPDGLGTMVPVIEQLLEASAVNVPLAAMVSAMVVPLSAVVFHAPAIVESVAAES